MVNCLVLIHGRGSVYQWPFRNWKARGKDIDSYTSYRALCRVFGAMRYYHSFPYLSNSIWNQFPRYPIYHCLHWHIHRRWPIRLMNRKNAYLIFDAQKFHGTTKVLRKYLPLSCTPAPQKTKDFVRYKQGALHNGLLHAFRATVWPVDILFLR